MRNYELLLVIRSSFDESGAADVAQGVVDRIQSLDGELTSTNVWGRRKLAYPIDNQLEAIYILLKFKSNPASLKDLDFDLKLNEALLRFLLVKDIDPETAILQEEAVAEDATAEANEADEAEADTPEAAADEEEASAEESAVEEAA